MFERIEAKLANLEAGQAEIRRLLEIIIRQGVIEMAAIDDLQADVTAEDTVIEGAVALINGFAAQLAAAGVDPAKLASLRSDIQARTQALAAAVATNSSGQPAANPPTP